MKSSYTVVIVLVFLYLLRRVIELRRKIASVDGDYPGFRVFLSRPSFWGNLIPWRIPGVNMKPDYFKTSIRKDFERFGWDICSCINIWPWQVYFLVCDAAAVKEVTKLHSRFIKPLWQYEVFTLFGTNIIASEGEEWKRHRKPINPAFSERNNKYVCEETAEALLELFAGEWKGQDVIEINKFEKFTVEFTIMMIGSTGFGRKASKEENNLVPPGHTLSFVETVRIVSSDNIFKAVLPNWVMNLTPRFRRINRGFVEFDRYLKQMIEDRKAGGEGTEDLFSLLLGANEADDNPQTKLTDSELIGNMYIFLFAGHETSAHALAFVIGRLALHQDEQEKLYQHINKVLPNNEVPTYEKLNLLTMSLAALYETLRLHPSVVWIPKVATEDTTLTVGGSCGKTRTVAIPKGTYVDIVASALHMNPRYWKDPEEFKLSRFLGDWPRDAFVPYSAGARSCIGRRFNETESVVFITMLVQRYRIEVLQEHQFAYETVAQRKERVLGGTQVITWTPNRVPIVLRRRK